MFTEEEIKMLRFCLLQEERYLQRNVRTEMGTPRVEILTKKLSVLRNLLIKLAVLENSKGAVVT